jgi:hypothetical protein
MVSISSRVGLTLLRRQPAVVRACVRRSSPCPPSARWSSTKSAVEEKPHQASQHYAKGKERALEDIPREDKTTLIELAILEVEREIEKSANWEDARARYPGLKQKQVSLVALLDGVIQKMKEAKAPLSGTELSKLHHTILKADRNLRNMMAGGRRFQESSVAYTIMLKYAYRQGDARGLKMIAKEALSWKHRSTASTSSSRNKQPRYIHPRVAAADELYKLIRNLFVSMSVRHGTRIDSSRDLFAGGSQLPSGLPNYIQDGDDAMTISMMLRQRVGAFKSDRNQEDQTSLKLAKDARISSYPLTHISSRLRRINRMAERGQLERLIGKEKLVKSVMTNVEKPESSSTYLTTAPAVIINAPSQNQTEVMDLLASPQGNELKAQRMEALRGSLGRWQRELSKRMSSRRYMLGVIRQFRIKPDMSNPQTAEAVKQLLPAWLVLTILRLQIESGDIQRAEKAVEVYLKSLSRVYEGKKLSEVVPVDEARVHAITSPLIPPNGSSLLNGILRAHLNSGASDCFELMLTAIERWAFIGKNFKRSALKRPNDKGCTFERPPWAGCLVPNQDTVMILFEALRMRVSRYTLGKQLIEEMWLRWGIVGLGDERKDESLMEPKRHQALKIPQQAFTALLRWAQTSRPLKSRQKRIDDVIAMEARWRQKAFGSLSTFNGASIEHKVAWKKALHSAKRQESAKCEDTAEDLSLFSEYYAEDEKQEENKAEEQQTPLYFTRN